MDLELFIKAKDKISENEVSLKENTYVTYVFSLFVNEIRTDTGIEIYIFHF
jgi:hypothetical protein